MDNDNNIPKSRQNINRRDMIRNSGAFGLAAGTFLIANETLAQGVHGFRNRVKRYNDQKLANPKPSQSWLDSIMPNTKKKADPASTPHPGLFQAATGVTEIGVKSRAYCVDAIKKGDGSLVPALKTIEAMIPVLNALGKLAELDATRLKEQAKTAHSFLDDCERECTKHASAHPALQPCANACTHAKLQIKALIGA